MTSIVDTDVIDLQNEFIGALNDLDAYLQPFLHTPLTHIGASLCDEDMANLNASIAYLVNALFFVYVKTKPSHQHEASDMVRKDMSRIKVYMNKVKEAAALIAQKHTVEAADEVAADANADADADGRAAAEKYLSQVLAAPVDDDSGKRKAATPKQKYGPRTKKQKRARRK